MHEKTFMEGLLKGKCPRCRQGEIFPYSAYNLKKFSNMNEACPHCGVRLEPEPGFYQGAMFVSYAFTVAILVAVSLVIYVFGGLGEWESIGIIIAVMFLLAPLNYRYSRIVFLYFFGGLRPKPGA